MTSSPPRREPPQHLYRRLRRRLGRLAVNVAPGTTARLLGMPPPARMPRLGPFRIAPERLASQIKFMADTGAGTDACLKLGALPVPVHFYSPSPTSPTWTRARSLRAAAALVESIWTCQHSSNGWQRSARALGRNASGRMNRSPTVRLM